MDGIKGKVALVTGGSRGIGKAVSRRLAKEGAYVVINYARNSATAEETLEEIVNAGGQAEIRQFDVTDLSSVQTEVDRIIKEKGELHILINNAGITKDTLLVRMKESDFAEVIAVNLFGTFNCTKAVARTMMKQRYGRIVNLTSVSGEMGNAGQSNYAASKSGIIGFTKSTAREMAPRGITVNAVSPGFIVTDITNELPEEVVKDYINRIPMGKSGTTDDIAGVIAFLCSDDASYLTGDVIRVNGGLYT